MLFRHQVQDVQSTSCGLKGLENHASRQSPSFHKCFVRAGTSATAYGRYLAGIVRRVTAKRWLWQRPAAAILSTRLVDDPQPRFFVSSSNRRSFRRPGLPPVLLRPAPRTRQTVLEKARSLNAAGMAKARAGCTGTVHYCLHYCFRTNYCAAGRP